ncbi:MAG TPA: hypothetical protein VFZ44_18700 [Pyrinomonadaceae bacterium]
MSMHGHTDSPASAVDTRPAQPVTANGYHPSTDDNEQKSSSNEWIKANTGLFVWLIFLAFGGGILALYYAKIGYLPDMEWSSSLIYIAVASIIGGSIGGVLFLSLFLPGFIWAEHLIHDSKLKPFFCYREEADTGRDKPGPASVAPQRSEGKVAATSRYEPSIIFIFAYLGLPFGLIFSLEHFFLDWGWQWYLLTSGALIAIGSVIVFSIFTYKWWIDKWNKVCPREEGGIKFPPPVVRRLQYVFWFDLSVVLSLVSTYLIYNISDKPRGEYFYYLSVICVLVVLISNHVVASRYRQHPWRAATASFVAAVMLLVVGNQLTSLTEKIMSLYGYGKGHAVTILLNNEGAQIIGRLGLSNTSCGSEAQDKLCGVEILSGMGSEYYLRLNGTTFTLPKSAVVSRSVPVKNHQ